jgi:hypothetical protein
MSDVWVSVMSHLTPREAKHLIAAVRGLRVTMCKDPSVNDIYLCGDECPCMRLQTDIDFLKHHYPRFMLQAVDFSCIVEYGWKNVQEFEPKSSMFGVEIVFSNTGVLCTYRFRVDST